MGHVGLILDELEKVGGRIVFVADGLDTSRPGVRPIIAILAEQARAESDNTSWRVGQWHLHNRRHGVWNQQRPYGYVVDEDGRLKPHPTEASIVRRMKDDFLGGSSLRGIARWLNDEGIKPPGIVHAEEARAAGRRAKGPLGDSWYATTVRKVLSQPAIAALVSHNRKLLYNEHGEPSWSGVPLWPRRGPWSVLASGRAQVAPPSFCWSASFGAANVAVPPSGNQARVSTPSAAPGSAAERAVEGRISPRSTLRTR